MEIGNSPVREDTANMFVMRWRARHGIFLRRESVHQGRIRFIASLRLTPA
jgi:hypothetical protein